LRRVSNAVSVSLKGVFANMGKMLKTMRKISSPRPRLSLRWRISRMRLRLGFSALCALKVRFAALALCSKD
jgi:hypothetical protein